ncbi:MAG: YncE family protein [Bacteroidia bacterium]|nr:YncE family protein [Bacteroidia bacterium]
MKLIVILTASLFLFIVSSCHKDHKSEPQENHGKGVFILNEGNFQANNGSLSYYNLQTDSVINNVFYLANNRLLGDIPQSMVIKDSLGYIVVNNSAKIEVINTTTFKSKAQITNFISPRYMLFTGTDKAYVSNMSGNTIDIVDLQGNIISGHISVDSWIEQMVKTGDFVFAVEEGSNRVVVINSVTDQVIYHIQVNEEPNSVLIDKNNDIWVLCSGGWTGSDIPSLNKISVELLEVEKSYPFDTTVTHYPTKLCINKTMDTLYFLNSGIYRMPISSLTLPAQPFIYQGSHQYYGLGVDPKTSNIYVSDAIDYQQRGTIFVYRPNGILITSFKTDINPGFFCFQ